MACAAAAVAAAAAVGIDLGTTNSAVAVLRKGETYPTIIRDSTGSFTIPSVVSYSLDGRCIVGQLAKQQAAANPLNTFYSVKRLIGRKFEEVQDLELVYGAAADEQGGVQLLCPARAAPLTPQEVTAAALHHSVDLIALHQHLQHSSRCYVLQLHGSHMLVIDSSASRLAFCVSAAQCTSKGTAHAPHQAHIHQTLHSIHN